jgi:hypothetical protein
MGGLEHCSERLQREMKGTRGAWWAVQAVGEGVEVGLGVDGQIGALAQVLAQQPVGVLAGSSLPGAVRVTEVDLHARAGSELAVARHLLALVVRHTERLRERSSGPP